MTPIFYGKVEKGVLLISNKEVFKSYLRNFEGKDIALTIKEPSRTRQRSNKENSYLWGVVYQIISQHTGYHPEEVHEAMKWKFLKKEGELMDTVISTASLDTIAFEQYVEKVRSWAGQYLQLVIPLPNEVEA